MTKNISNDFILDWLHSNGKEIGLSFKINKCIPIYCYIDDFYKVKQNIDWRLFKFSIDNLIKEEFEKYYTAIPLFIKHSSKMLLLCFPKLQSGSIISSTIRKHLVEINQKVKKYFNISFTAIEGYVIDFPDDLRKQLQLDFNHLDRLRFYLSNGSIANFKKVEVCKENLFDNYSEILEHLKRLVLSNEKKELIKTANKIIMNIKEKQYDPKEVRSWVLSLLFDIQLMAKNIFDNLGNEMFHINSDEIIRTETLSELNNIFRNNLVKVTRNLDSLEVKSDRIEIIKAKKYVLMNLGKKISLYEVAEHLHLNPSYFSRLFKQETNENFIDFVNRSKMEKAKEIIDTTSEPIEEVANRLGFDNKSYFLKIFKKYYGVPPKQYKKMTISG